MNRGCFLLLLALVLQSPVQAEGITAGWRALADYRADEALRIFRAHEQTTDRATARAARFAHGVALLARQPVTETQIDAARRIFTDLATSADDDPALGALFYLARIAQHHSLRPDPEAADRFYRRLLATAPDSVWAQTALGRYAMLEVYALHSDEAPAVRVARAEHLLALAQVPAARSDLHQVLAEAIFHYRLPAVQALPHLVAAEQIGLLDIAIRPDVLVQIAEISRLEGDVVQARKYYERFLTEYPRENRDYMVQQRLQALAGAAVAP